MFRRFIPVLNSTSGQAVKMSIQAGGGKLKGKVAVVTASTDGIGFAIAQRLARDGASVVISSRKDKNVDSAVKKLQEEGLTVTGLVCHVSKASDREQLFEKAKSTFGGIDILISNAAANPTMGHVFECDETAWDKIFDINVKSAYLLSKEVLPYLRERGGGSIVYIASIAGFQPFDLLGAYSVSKTALLGLTKAAAPGLANENIRVNCVAPGVVETRFAGALVDNEVAKEITLSKIPMNRLGQPPEIAGIVSFLCSEDASYMTGETVVVSGGMSSRL